MSPEVEQSALARQTRLAALHGIRLTFEEAALEAMAEEAVVLGTGARGLARLMGRVVDAVDHRWPELADEGVTGVRVTAGTVVRGEAQVLERDTAGALPRRDAVLRARSLGGCRRDQRRCSVAVPKRFLRIPPAGATSGCARAWSG